MMLDMIKLISSLNDTATSKGLYSTRYLTGGEGGRRIIQNTVQNIRHKKKKINK